MHTRAILSVALFTLAFPVFAAGPEQGKGDSESSGAREIVTMANMRSMVPSLVALGWNDFFLSREKKIGLSRSQTEALLSIRLAFLAATEEVDRRLKEAELDLYKELDGDQVSALEVEERVRWVSVLRGELSALRFRYLLRAIKVLNHDQHKELAAPSWPLRGRCRCRRVGLHNATNSKEEALT